MYDLTAKQPLFSERASTMRPPASVEKLYTATTALERMGASAHLSTTVLRDRQARAAEAFGKATSTCAAAGTRRSAPAPSSAPTTTASARRSPRSRPAARTDGIRHITGSVYGDESCSTPCAASPPATTCPTRSWKARSRGSHSTAAHRRRAGPHAPAAYAAHELLAALRARWRQHRRTQRRRHHAGRGDSAGAGRFAARSPSSWG